MRETVIVAAVAFPDRAYASSLTFCCAVIASPS
jgi:hypothetical protein